MKNKIKFILSLVFGLMFINAGMNKFFNYMPVPDDLPEGMFVVMEAFMTIGLSFFVLILLFASLHVKTILYILGFSVNKNLKSESLILIP